MTTAVIEQLLTRKEVAALLKVSLDTLTKLTRHPDPEQRLPFVVIANCHRFSPSEVEAWRQRLSAAAAPAPTVRNSRYRD